MHILRLQHTLDLSLSISLSIFLSLPLHLLRTVTSLSSFLGNINVHNMNGSPIPSATSMSPTQNGSNIMSVDGKRILCTADVRGKITLSIICGYLYGCWEIWETLHHVVSFSHCQNATAQCTHLAVPVLFSFQATSRI